MLPINCPARSTIEGSPEDTVEAAQFSAVLEACKQLRSINELDENMLPLGRDGPSKSKHLKESRESKFDENLFLVIR